MRIISCRDGRLRTLSELAVRERQSDGFITRLPALDALAPGQAFARAAVHELLGDDGDARSRLPAAVLARSAAREHDGVIVWADPDGTLYPPALAAAGIDPRRLLILRPGRACDLTWALTECLRCRQVCAVVGEVGRLSKIEARRLQLAAETGGTVGILLRESRGHHSAYAAATRWRVCSIPGEPRAQRWGVQLIHGHGGRVGHNVILELDRETNLVRATGELADLSRTAPERATA